ncbi:MAG: hypothetical protein AB7O87_16065 [Candidatus Nitrosocosmicus sp.]
MTIQCPHCFLDMKKKIQLNEELSECPSCEEVWADSFNLEKIFNLRKDNTIGSLTKQFHNNTGKNISKEYGDYYYYKKPFQKNINKDELSGFE